MLFFLILMSRAAIKSRGKQITTPSKPINQNLRSSGICLYTLFCLRGFSNTEINWGGGVCYYFSYEDIIPMGDDLRKKLLDKYCPVM